VKLLAFGYLGSTCKKAMQANPWAILAGIAIAPVVFLALVGGLLKVLLTFLWPSFASWWAWIATGPVFTMRWTVEKLTHLPWGDVPVPAPALWLMGLFFLLVLSTLIPCRRSGVLFCRRAGIALSIPLLVFLPFRPDATPQSASSGEVRMTLLAIGAGQCAVIEPPSGRTILIDAGSSSLTDLLSKCLGPFLRHEQETSIDSILISHADMDHFSAVGEVVAGYDVHEVIAAHGFTQLCRGNPAAEQMLAELNRCERPPREVLPGDRMPLGRDMVLEVLWPPKDSAGLNSAGLNAGGLTDNDASMVVMLTHAGRKILFTGDIQAVAMKELLKTPEKLKADVLIAPHHGSSEDTTAAFVKAVSPKYILSSNDRTLTGKQRRFDEITKGMAVYRTNVWGAVTVRISREGELRVETFLDEKGRPRK
jgi:competence protein ComEC